LHWPENRIFYQFAGKVLTTSSPEGFLPQLNHTLIRMGLVSGTIPPPVTLTQ
jgi:hypothetical protein